MTRTLRIELLLNSAREFTGALFLRVRWKNVLAAIPREVLLE